MSAPVFRETETPLATASAKPAVTPWSVHAATLFALLLANPERIHSLGRSGRQSAFEKFSAEAMARSTVDFYQEAVSIPASVA